MTWFRIGTFEDKGWDAVLFRLLHSGTCHRFVFLSTGIDEESKLEISLLPKGIRGLNLLPCSECAGMRKGTGIHCTKVTLLHRSEFMQGQDGCRRMHG